MRSRFIIFVLFTLIISLTTQQSADAVYASATNYLKQFMNSGIDCGIIWQDAGHVNGDVIYEYSGDVHAQCFSSKDAKYVNFYDSSGQQLSRGSNWLNVNTLLTPGIELKNTISNICNQWLSGQVDATTGHFFTRDAWFTLVTSPGKPKSEWFDIAAQFIRTKFKALPPCEFLAANPNFEKIGGTSNNNVNQQLIGTSKFTISKKPTPNKAPGAIKQIVFQLYEYKIKMSVTFWAKPTLWQTLDINWCSDISNVNTSNTGIPVCMDSNSPQQTSTYFMPVASPTGNTWELLQGKAKSKGSDSGLVRNIEITGDFGYLFVGWVSVATRYTGAPYRVIKWKCKGLVDIVCEKTGEYESNYYHDWSRANLVVKNVSPNN